MYKKDFSRMDSLLKRFAEEGTNPGCAVAVMQGDELIYHGEAGYADIASGRKADLHSMFSQASTTKLFTYAILGMIYEEGRFLFSDPLYYYLPEWKNTQKYVMRPNGDIDTEPLENPITIRDAVAMMCGLPYCMMPSAGASTPTLAAMSRRFVWSATSTLSPATRDCVEGRSFRIASTARSSMRSGKMR